MKPAARAAWGWGEVVGGDGQGGDGLDLGPAARFRLGEAARLLDPAEDFFDPFPDAVTDGVAGVAQRPVVDRGLAGFAGLRHDARNGDMRRHGALAPSVARRPPPRRTKGRLARHSGQNCEHLCD
jgi:hypothetical protein